MIVTYYSYKGGVGRSQLCANIASYLCHKKDKKVLLMDWDFEAPGLHYFFDKANSDINRVGTIELLIAYSRMMRTQNDVSENDYSFYNIDNIIPLITSKGNGKVDIIPAGNYNETYALKVNNFDWYEFYELLDGKAFIEALKSWLNDQDYDYVFIDSRTGINDYSGICNIQLPDINVVVMVANNQNIDGCERIINQISDSEYVKLGYRKPYIFPVLSRIDYNHPSYSEWSSKFTEKFHHLVTRLDENIDSQFSKDVFSEFYLDRTLLTHEVQFSAGENLLISDSLQAIPRNSFISKFANLGDYILKIESNSEIALAEQIDIQTWLSWANEAERKGNKLKAAIAYEKAGENEKSIEMGGTAESFLKMGNKFYLLGELEEAIPYYKSSIDAKHDNHVAYFNLGLAYNNLENYFDAIESYKKAVEILPDKYEAWGNLGNVYYRLGNHVDSMQCCKRAIEINPDFHIAWNNLGVIYDNTDDRDNAITCFQNALSIKSDYNVAYNGLGFALFKRGGSLEEAEAMFLKGLSFGGSDAVNMNLGHVNLIKGQELKALAYYLDSFKAFTNTTLFWVNMEEDFKYLSQYGIARDTYDKISEKIKEKISIVE